MKPDRRRLDPVSQLRIALCELNGAPPFEQWAAEQVRRRRRRHLLTAMPFLILAALVALAIAYTSGGTP